MSTSTVTVSRRAIEMAIVDALKLLWSRGEGWFYIRLYPDGQLTVGMERSEQEFTPDLVAPPRNVFLWSKKGQLIDRYDSWTSDPDAGDLTQGELVDRVESYAEVGMSLSDIEDDVDAAVELAEAAGYEVAD